MLANLDWTISADATDPVLDRRVMWNAMLGLGLHVGGAHWVPVDCVGSGSLPLQVIILTAVHLLLVVLLLRRMLVVICILAVTFTIAVDFFEN